jgi:hypothetical protein
MLYGKAAWCVEEVYRYGQMPVTTPQPCQGGSNALRELSLLCTQHAGVTPDSVAVLQ